MISHLFDSVAPVFLLVLAGYVAVRLSLLDDTVVDALTRYAVRLAIPCLLFRAVSTIDLGAAYDWRVMGAYYVPALVCFVAGAVAARWVFGRRPGEAVAVGFIGLFSNLVILALPLVEGTLGEAAMPTAYAVVSVHTPFCYLVGIVAMELVRADGRSLPETAAVVARTLFRNPMTVAIGLGFAVNLGRFPVPAPLGSALGMVADSALAVALVGLGGVLTRYTLSERLGETVTVTGLSLVLHPLLAFALCALLGVPDGERQVIVLMASMSPGVNVYLFASLYGRAENAAASAVLLGTVAAVGSVTLWSWFLSGA